MHSGLNILKVKDMYNTSLLLFVHANLQGDCPAVVKNYFVRRNSVYNTRQTGHLEYRRARLDLGTSRVQYHAAELWNLLSDAIKNIPYRKHFKRSLCDKIVLGYNGQFVWFWFDWDMPLVAGVAKGYCVINFYQRWWYFVWSKSCSLLLLLLFNFALCYIISSCPNHVEFNLKAASFDELAVVSLAAIKWYIYL